MAQYQDERERDDGAGRQEQQPAEIALRGILDDAEHLRAKIAAEIADRVDRGDARRRSGAAEKRRR